MVTLQNEEIGIPGYLAQYNEWYPMPEKWHSEQASCSGFDTREPWYWFDEHRLVFTYEILDYKKTIDMDSICDDVWMRSQIDPRNLYRDFNPVRQDRVENRIKHYEDYILHMN